MLQHDQDAVGLGLEHVVRIAVAKRTRSGAEPPRRIRESTSSSSSSTRVSSDAEMIPVIRAVGASPRRAWRGRRPTHSPPSGCAGRCPARGSWSASMSSASARTSAVRLAISSRFAGGGSGRTTAAAQAITTVRFSGLPAGSIISSSNTATAAISTCSMEHHPGGRRHRHVGEATLASASWWWLSWP